MTNTQSRLFRFAESRCLPYLIDLPKFRDYLDQLSFILVGSVATGLCNEKSDIDIAIICDEKVYDSISKETQWDKGKPSEGYLDNIQLHYYAITFSRIENRLRELDDIFFYVYGNFIALRDLDSQYTKKFREFFLRDSELRKQRLEGKLDMLLRRKRGFESALNEKDILLIARICLELITLCLKVIALLDNIPFDPRKRLFKTALLGDLGSQLEDKIQCLFYYMGELGQSDKDFSPMNFRFYKEINEIIQIISNEARKQGFRVGLDKIDVRHLE